MNLKIVDRESGKVYEFPKDIQALAEVACPDCTNPVLQILERTIMPVSLQVGIDITEEISDGWYIDIGNDAADFRLDPARFTVTDTDSIPRGEVLQMLREIDGKMVYAQHRKL